MKEIFDIKKLIDEADCILIGAGAGLSTAAGINYAGDEFKENFDDFIKKYNFTDLYTSSFYDFDTQEEYWAYWAKHIDFANTGRDATNLYKNIYEAVKNKDYFVVTTNVDDQFYKSGFSSDRIFRVQGSYALNQCVKACHNKLYPNKKLVDKMLLNIDKDLKIPTKLVPVCPKCGENMEPNLRKDAYFVEDDLWYKQNNVYREFLAKNKDKKLLLLEFGVGFNTPGIIRFPFEQMTSKNINWTLVRFNKETQCFYDIDENRYIAVNKDLNEIF